MKLDKSDPFWSGASKNIKDAAQKYYDSFSEWVWMPPLFRPVRPVEDSTVEQR